MGDVVSFQSTFGVRLKQSESYNTGESATADTSLIVDDRPIRGHRGREDDAIT